MKKYIISQLTTMGGRRYLRRAVPIVWSQYECNALPLSDSASAGFIKFLKEVNPRGIYERMVYHPPKLP